MVTDIIPPIAYLQTGITLLMALIGCLTALHKTIRRIYNSVYVKVFTALLVVGGITILCVSSVTDIVGYKIILKARYRIEQLRVENEIAKLNKEMNNVYKDIGRNVYYKEQIDELMNNAQQYNTQISLKQKEAYEIVDKYKERLDFENVLKDIASVKIETRCEAIKNLAMMGKSESLPYLLLCSNDLNPVVRNEAAAAISLLNQAPDYSAQDENISNEANITEVPVQMTVPANGSNQAVMDAGKSALAGSY